MQSRLSVYLHPLAGRPLCWHALRALASRASGPREIFMVAGPEIPADLFRDFDPPVRIVATVEELLPVLPDGEPVVLVDGAAPTVGSALDVLLAAPGEIAVSASGDRISAARIGAETTASIIARAASARWSDALPERMQKMQDPLAMIVRDRASLSRATLRVRDDTVARLMEGGVTFLLPESNLVDFDVRIGRDSVIYPGVVLEGQTTIGEETVVGPGSRIIDSWIGSGVEMKGWNYISHTSVRNRAILEPYTRRGFD